MATAEVWKPVAGASRYEVSNLGRFRRGGVLHKPSRVPGRMGYLRVSLRYDDGRKTTAYLHHLVIEHFSGPRPTGMLALHKDGDVLNCRADNLYWGTYLDNSCDRVRHGRSGRGVSNPNVFLADWQIDDIRQLYSTGDFRQMDLALAYGVSQTHISRIVRRKSWSHA